MQNKLTKSGYELSKDFFDWSFENPDKVKPIHSALYFFIIDKCNRLGWKQKFGLPSEHAMEALGVKNWKTYIKALNDLHEFGFIEFIERSKNQYTSNIIALVNFGEATDKALSKATSKQGTEQVQSIVSIDKHSNLKTENEEQDSKISPAQDKHKQLTPEEKEVEAYKQHLKQQKSDYPDDWVRTPSGDYRPPHAKDKYKGKDQVNANPDDLKHVDFVKEYAAGAYEKQIKMRYAAKIKDRDSFIRKFNNKCVIKEVPFKTSTILAEMENFAITWIYNQK